MFATPIANDANVLSATTGLHPITLVRNVAWEHQENRLARFEGFPKQSKLVDLKQQAVDEAEYGGPGCRLGGKGWGVHWNPSVTVESDLKGLVERLGECRERLPVNDYIITAGLKHRYRSISKPHGPGSGSESYAHSAGQPLALDGGTRPTFVAEKAPLVFDTILISPPPLEVSTEMLRGLPIKELAAKPAFCFLWVRDSSEVELCSDIMQEWGFRSVERMAWFAAGSLTRHTQGEVESLDLPEGELFPLLKDLGFPNASSELGLCAEDFLSFTPLESGNGQATLSHCVATTAWGTGGTPEHFGSNYSPGCLEPFHRTARFCLVGMNGKIKR
ncbi:MAG: hypothetical protein M1840_001001 [Geoglossum simile]|nr:MAG: hypothetical protein M1840_001001 [Geoglossum simile]